MVCCAEGQSRGRLSIKRNEPKLGVLEGGKDINKAVDMCMCMFIYKCMRIMDRCGLEWVRLGWGWR